MKKITEEWLKAAHDDLLVIEKIIDSEYLTHIVAFHAQQAIEKTIKAVMEETNIDIPKIHNLLTLFVRIEDNTSYTVDQDLLKTLDALYIDSRYPGDFGLLPNGKPDLKDAQIFFQEASQLYEVIKKEIESFSLLNVPNKGSDSTS